MTLALLMARSARGTANGSRRPALTNGASGRFLRLPALTSRAVPTGPFGAGLRHAHPVTGLVMAAIFLFLAPGPWPRGR